jgi:hypothetical protein
MDYFFHQTVKLPNHIIIPRNPNKSLWFNPRSPRNESFTNLPWHRLIQRRHLHFHHGDHSDSRLDKWSTATRRRSIMVDPWSTCGIPQRRSAFCGWRLKQIVTRNWDPVWTRQCIYIYMCRMYIRVCIYIIVMRDIYNYMYLCITLLHTQSFVTGLQKK